MLLLVDDLPENLFALEQMLRRDDLDIVTAGSGPEALERLLEHRVALAIVDVQMPEMDGFQLATIMRGVERTRHVPIIFVTAASLDRQRVFRGYDAGAVDFLFKPLDVHVLRGKVDVFVTLERQRRELEASENRFRALIQATSQAVWRLSGEGLFIDGFAAWHEATGQSHEDWRQGRWLEAVHPEDRERVKHGWQNALAERSPFQSECRLRRADGEFTWIHARAAPVFDEHRELFEWIGSISDIDERMRHEKMREVLVAILGHDLRNPLSSMMVGAQVALSCATDETIRKSLERVLRGGERMARMIEQILEMARIRGNRSIVLAPAPTDLLSLVRQVVQGAPTRERQLQVESVGDPSGVWDPDRLFQILSNLVGNACEHGADELPVVVRIDGQSTETVRVRVENGGPAIPEELRGQLFEPFRGTERRTAGNKGVGLGLYITKQFVLAHGGTIEVTSSDDRGTVFEVRLPRAVKDDRNGP
ncbi:Response regulator/sensor histidine kinase [Vulgatibacter incomptus]|uniref:histidine kinase n=1 Tax=Vulgatibacter incomptus TaxID=1391653 RepID=A0A0K1PI75_9BACT|nr:Response regulator/sensor histidine kinase [Vulgatibacter incomptus]